ncbi:hypothetical protein IJH02_03465 [Candidatus Saccharibacteria bacterium]|nr:hypothetical protein [Candidatus Saccharibacteria bacterium]
MYDVRGLDGTGTSANPVTSGANVKTYTVRKLADGNCWMTEDLKLGGNSAVTLTSSETDLAQGTTYTLPVENTGTWCDTDSAACDNQSLWIKTGVPNGYLYNWYTATAGTGTYELTSDNAAGSICPKGWKLPTGGSGGQFATLDVAYGGSGENRSDVSWVAKFTADPLSFNYTGYVDGTVSSTVNRASYWSRTANTTEINAFRFDFRIGGNFILQFSSSKFTGYAIRCLAASS